MSRLSDSELLALHRALVSTPSVSGGEAPIADLLAGFLAAHGHAPRRIGDSLLLLVGEGPLLLLDSHVDTVPPAPGWRHDPFVATAGQGVEAGRVYGLGANDAKASVSAMTAAFLALAGEPLGLTVGLALVAGEETKSQGTRDVLDALRAEGVEVAAALFGEPTGLDLAVAQKGLLVLELSATGDAAHAAHARALGARNAALRLAHDLVAIERIEWSDEHPALGPTTIVPTVVAAGSARNVVPATASAILDVRTTPALAPEGVVARLRAAVAGGIAVRSDRFAPRETPAGSALLAAASTARPGAQRYGSATLSDWALLPAAVPAIKVGPGRSERSHTPDEFVLESEILGGARFYEALARAFAAELAARSGIAAPGSAQRADESDGMSRLWDKGAPLDRRVLAFTAGDDHALDARLVPYDVRASIAHAEMLAAQGLLDPGDLAAIRSGLAALADEHARGLWAIELADEDVHTALERRLTERIGAAGGRVHLGRSRNDQLLAALRLYLKDELVALAAGARGVAAALGQLAAAHADLPIPGYTHMQRAMPSSVALWAGGFAAALEDDALGIEGCRRRLDRNPLGSAAGYGTPGLPIDREATRRTLGFAENEEPVTAVQLARGKAEAQLLFELALLAGDCGRLAADLLLFSTAEYGIVELPEDLTTGSSIMPQKRNPDLFELVRGHGAAALAALVEVLAIPAKLPSGYQRDLQLLKPPLFRAIDRAHATSELLAAVLPRLRFRPDRIALAPELFAAEEAHRLVIAEGIPFREAYRRVAARFTTSGAD